MVMVPTYRRRLIAAAALSLVAFGCGRRAAPAGGASHPASIATDLPDDGSAQPPVELYWVTDGHLFRGRCAARDVLLPSYCTQNIQSMDYGAFKLRLDGGLSDTIRQLQDEARQIQASMTALSSEIQATLAQIDQLGRQTGGLSVELQALRAQMQNFDTIVREYQTQLTLIDQALSQVADQDMTQLRTYVMAQLAKYQDQLSALSTKVSALLAQLAADQADLSALQHQADQLNIRLANLKTDLDAVQSKLSGAYDDFSVYQGTLDKLTSGIIHPILSDNTWWQKQRRFVRRFDQIFSTGL